MIDPDADPDMDPIEPIAGSKEMSALAHLYRAEVYRSTIWRQRLDMTTNWAVVSTGIALSVVFQNEHSSPMPIALVCLLTFMFLFLEARRYRFFGVWKFRARMLELAVFVPLLQGKGATIPMNMGSALSDDYQRPKYRIGFWRAVGRRLRRNYFWIFTIQLIALFAKVALHPIEVKTVGEFLERYATGPVHGGGLLLATLAAYGVLVGVVLWTGHKDRTDTGRTSDYLGLEPTHTE